MRPVSSIRSLTSSSVHSDAWLRGLEKARLQDNSAGPRVQVEQKLGDEVMVQRTVAMDAGNHRNSHPIPEADLSAPSLGQRGNFGSKE